jgi:hypothetical protein
MFGPQMLMCVDDGQPRIEGDLGVSGAWIRHV